ncbi:MAG: hypothetical protein C0483_17675 [Pirellula sp.]|nr:hypothetical protein [Pirellula sp.]
MQITIQTVDDHVEMRVEGRLDNESAEHLTAAVNDAVRQGQHSVVMHLDEVKYVSSAGLGALVRAYKQFKAVRGFFGVGSASPEVAETIRLTGLANLLMCKLDSVQKAIPSHDVTVMPTFRVATAADMEFEIYDLAPGAKLECRTYGDPRRVEAGYSRDDCRAIPCPVDMLGLGLGAFGRDFAECSPHFGEFLAVAGSVAQQPPQGLDKPDYQLIAGDYVPDVQMLYGLTCSGTPAQMIRFESVNAVHRVRFSELVEQCLAQVDEPQAALVFLAESAGLVGARLQRSPAAAEESSSARLMHPEIRRWLSFTPERTYPRTLALVVGVASRGVPCGEAAALAPLLRPLRPQEDVWGHFHAAVFTYRPFKKRKLDLKETVASLYENENLQCVLHLLNDDREISGGGESEFVSGACWLGPIRSVVAEEGR